MAFLHMPFRHDFWREARAFLGQNFTFRLGNENVVPDIRFSLRTHCRSAIVLRRDGIRVAKVFPESIFNTKGNYELNTLSNTEHSGLAITGSLDQFAG